jgi:GH15 family glucan-1,4-alpha-glucosidase
VSALARNGRVKEAQSLFRRLLSVGNDLGLFSEEYDVPHRRLIGNFPQAFSHLTLIAAARDISTAKTRGAAAPPKRERRRPATTTRSRRSRGRHAVA